MAVSGGVLVWAMVGERVSALENPTVASESRRARLKRLYDGVRHPASRVRSSAHPGPESEPAGCQGWRMRFRTRGTAFRARSTASATPMVVSTTAEDRVRDAGLRVREAGGRVGGPGDRRSARQPQGSFARRPRSARRSRPLRRGAQLSRCGIPSNYPAASALDPTLPSNGTYPLPGRIRDWGRPGSSRRSVCR